MAIGDRIREVRDSFKKTQGDLAQALGISLSSIQSYEANKSFPGGEVIKAFMDLGISPTWLLAGQGDMFLTQVKVDGYKAETVISSKACEQLSDCGEFAYIPQYDIEVSAGHGAFNGHEKIIAKSAFRQDWLKEKALDAAKLALVRVVGDSMLPTIAGGDMVLLDLRAAKARENAIYAIEVGGQIRIKRLQPKIDGSIIVQSDNPTYAPEQVPAAEADRLRVIGRAVWVGKSL